MTLRSISNRKSLLLTATGHNQRFEPIKQFEHVCQAMEKNKPGVQKEVWDRHAGEGNIPAQIHSFRQAALRLLSSGDINIADRHSIFQCFLFYFFLLPLHNHYRPSINQSKSNDLHSRVLLGKGASQSLEGVDNVLEGLLLLGGELGDVAGGGVLVLVGPLDLEGVELEVDVEAVDVLGGVRREAAELVDEGHELVDVVLGDVAALLGRLDAALVLRRADHGGAVGLANDFDGVGRGALGVLLV